MGSKKYPRYIVNVTDSWRGYPFWDTISSPQGVTRDETAKLLNKGERLRKEVKKLKKEVADRDSQIERLREMVKTQAERLRSVEP